MKTCDYVGVELPYQWGNVIDNYESKSLGDVSLSYDKDLKNSTKEKVTIDLDSISYRSFIIKLERVDSQKTYL